MRAARVLPDTPSSRPMPFWFAVFVDVNGSEAWIEDAHVPFVVIGAERQKNTILPVCLYRATTVPSAVIVPVPPEGDANTGSPANRLANTQRLVAGRLRGHCPRTGTANRAEDREVSDGFRGFIEGQLGQGQRPRLISLLTSRVPQSNSPLLHHRLCQPDRGS